MKFVAITLPGWICCLLVAGCLLSPDTRLHATPGARGPAAGALPPPRAGNPDATQGVRRAGTTGSLSTSKASALASRRATTARATSSAPVRMLTATVSPVRVPALHAALPTAASIAAERDFNADTPVPAMALANVAHALPAGHNALPVSSPPLTLPERTGASAMSLSFSDLLGSLLPSSPWLLYGALAILALLVVLLWTWRLRRRRARRAELRVWHPGRKGDAEAQTAAVDEILEPPAWLANATIRRRVTPSPLPSAAAATDPHERAPEAPATVQAMVPAHISLASEEMTYPSEAMNDLDGAVHDEAPVPPVEDDMAPLAPMPFAVAEPQRAPAFPSLSAGYATCLAPVPGLSLMSPPTPPITVRIEAAEIAADDSAPQALPLAAAEPDIVAPSGSDEDMPAFVSATPEAEAQTSSATALPVTLQQACTQARRLAAQGRQAEALALLRPVLDDNAPATAWAMAGWCAWNLAEEASAPLALAREAAHAFERALSKDPTREGALARMVGRCHLLQAEADVPAHRLDHLAAAVGAYERGFGQGMASESALLEWAQALHQSALENAPERAALLARLDSVLARAPDPLHTPSAWSRQRAHAAWLHAQGAHTAAERRRYHHEAARQAQLAHSALDGIPQRDAWLAEIIEAERRHLVQLSPAARNDGFRALAQRMLPLLSETQATAPLLAWVHVLAETSQWLQAPAARQRLGEADAMLARLEAMPGDAPDESNAVSFARAYYLRLRAAHEPASTRREVLAHAAQLLARLRQATEFPAQPGVILEQAEVALARADEGPDAEARFEEATHHASAAADLPPTRVAAFQVLLAALLGWQQRAPAPSRAQQIEVVSRWLAQADTPATADTLRLLADAALARQDVADAARLSAAAWEAGAEGHALLPGWRHADAAWARQLVEAAERSAWEHQHRLLRLAASSA